MASYKSDIEIAREVKGAPIPEIAKKAGIPEDYLEPYGKNKAKVDMAYFDDPKVKSAQDGKLILVTAITPTPAGEGKTTTTIGLADGLRKRDKNAMVAMDSGTMTASGPIFVPTRILDSGRTKIIRIRKGRERTMLMALLMTWFTKRFRMKSGSAVTKSSSPSRPPKMMEMISDRTTM